MDICGIYTITCNINNKIYVGKSVGCNERIWNHRYLLKASKHGNKYLQRAWNKHGEKNFKFEILLEIEEKYLSSEENYWCNLLSSHNPKYGYNIEPTSPHGRVRLATETRIKIGLANKGKKRSAEAIKSQILGQIGLKRSEATKLKLALLKAIPVIQFNKEEEFIARYESTKEASNLTGIRRGVITEHCRLKEEISTKDKRVKFIWRRIEDCIYENNIYKMIKSK